MEAAAAYIGISIRQRREPITFEQFQGNRLGKYRWVVHCSLVSVVLTYPLQVTYLLLDAVIQHIPWFHSHSHKSHVVALVFCSSLPFARFVMFSWIHLFTYLLFYHDGCSSISLILWPQYHIISCAATDIPMAIILQHWWCNHIICWVHSTQTLPKTCRPCETSALSHRDMHIGEGSRHISYSYIKAPLWGK